MDRDRVLRGREAAREHEIRDDLSVIKGENMYQEWVGYNINQMFDYACRLRGAKEALVFGERRYSYGHWRRRVLRIAAALRDLGVGEGTRVACLAQNSPRWTEVIFAVWRLGGIVVPLNMTWVGREIAQSLDLTDAELLVTVGEFRGKNYLSLLEDAVPELRGAVDEKLSLAKLPHLRRILTWDLDSGAHPYAGDLDAKAAASANFDAGELMRIGEAVDPASPCLYLPTSGSTGFPKPVIHTHQTFLAICSNFADAVEFGERDRMLNFGTTYHVSGLVLLVMPIIRFGSITQMDWFDPETAMRIIEQERITVVWGFDMHFLQMRRHPRFAAYDVSSIERTLVGSNPGSYDEIKSMGIGHQGSLYGCSEYLSHFFPYRDRFDEERMRNTNGRPFDGVSHKIVDPSTGHVVPTGSIGEICIKGPGLFKGYYRMPEVTAAVMDDEGFFHTGDYGFIDEKDYLYFRGRLKDTVKTGGENVAAQEVEMFLAIETPWVMTAQVFGVPDATWGEAVVAMVELKENAKVSEDELRDFCKGKLAGYKVPKRILFVNREDWVLTPTGKVDKSALRRIAMGRLGIARE